LLQYNCNTKTKRDLRLVNMEQDAAITIKSLIPLGLSNQEIADTLNEKYLNSGLDNKPFRRYTISNLIRKYNLPMRREFVETDGWLTTREKMDELGVTRNRLNKMRDSGMVVYKKSRIYNMAYLYKPEYSEIV